MVQSDSESGESHCDHPVAAGWRPDWKLSLVERVAVTLSLSLFKHVPDWPGATDEQIDAVAQDVMATIGSASGDSKD